MFDQIKAYWQLATGLVLIVTLSIGAYSLHHHGYQKGLTEKQIEFDNYKFDVQQAAEEQSLKSREIEVQQVLLTKQKEAEYAKVKRDRDAALSKLGKLRLCGDGKVEIMPRRSDLSVAESDRSAVSSEAKGSSRPDDTAALAASFDFGDAVRDRDQCIALQDWVKAQGM